MLRRGRPAVGLGGVLVQPVDVRQQLQGRGQGHVGVLVLRGPDYRFRRGHAGNPDGRVRFLQRHHPRVDHPVVVVLAFVAERAGLGPGVDDDVVRLVEPLAVVQRVGVGGHAFLPDAAHESADHAPAGEDVDHGDFLGDAQRIFVDGQHVAQEHDLALLGARGQHRADDVDRGHHAQRVVVMLVDHHAVEPRLGAVLELVEVHAVQPLRRLGAEVLVGVHQVVVAEALGLVLRIGGVTHFGEKEKFTVHNAPPIR